MGTTLQQVQESVTEYNRQRQLLAAIGREIYFIRTSNKIDNYGFDSWRVSISDGLGDYDEDDVVFPEGTQIVKLAFYHQRWNDEHIVTIPASYLDGTNAYVEIERAALDERARIKDQQDKDAEIQAEIETREARRQLFVELQQEFGEERLP